jgi:hypothetical protein
VILLDTSGLLAALDPSQNRHAEAAASLAAAAPPRLLSPFVLAELDCLVARRVGERARLDLLEEVARGAYTLQSFASDDVGDAIAVMRRHADLEISLADASIAVLAARSGALDVLTLDERHFRVVSVEGRPLRLLPADQAS